MTLLRAGWLVLVSAVVTAAAAEPDAPLANTSKALQQLQQEQTAQNSTGAKGKLTDGVPDFQTPLPGMTAPEPPPSARTQAELKKKKDDHKNWLVDGVNTLEQENKGKDGKPNDKEAGPIATEQAKQEVASDSSDPNLLLKLYSEQKEASAAKGAGHLAPPVMRDAFAPFMQEWLGSSPAHGKFSVELGRPSDSGGAAPVVAGPGSAQLATEGVTGLDLAPRPLPPAPAANPYLQGLDWAGLTDSAPNRSPATVEVIAPDKPIDFQPSTTSAAAAAAASTVDRKTAPPPADDDKKYFPQLKKF